MRILHIISSLTIDSGVTSFVMNYYKNVDRDKIQFDFLYFEKADNEVLNEIKNLGGNIYYIRKPSLKYCIQSYKDFNIFFHDYGNNFSVVHLHELYLVHFIKIFVKKYKINHLITHAHTTKYSDKTINAIRNKIMCLGLKYSATDLFACSIDAGEFYYGKTAVEKGLVKVIPNAISLEKYKFNQSIRNNVRKSLKIDDKFVVGHIGRMTPQKNQKFLLKIFTEVKKENDKAVLLIVGDGSLRKEIESEIKRLNLQECVILLGVRNDVPNLLMAMDVFVLPSLFEGLGIVAIEAQATGLKCILSGEVPKEVDCGNCEFVSLNQSFKIWSKYINLNINFKCDRNNIGTKIVSYDILKNSNYLFNIYIQIEKGK